MNHIQNHKFKMSASEMQCFVYYLPLMIDDLIDNKSDSVWQLFLKLTEMIDMCMQPSFTENDLNMLQNIIQLHHDLYLANFPNNRLIPKHRFLLHYVSIIKQWAR